MREFVTERIKGPEFLGISQRGVEDYYDYIRDFFLKIQLGAPRILMMQWMLKLNVININMGY